MKGGGTLFEQLFKSRKNAQWADVYQAFISCLTTARKKGLKIEFTALVPIVTQTLTAQKLEIKTHHIDDLMAGFMTYTFDELEINNYLDELAKAMTEQDSQRFLSISMKLANKFSKSMLSAADYISHYS
jgi:flagellar motor component MotA